MSVYTPEVKQSNFSLFLANLMTVGGATAISKTATAPLERVRTILQAQTIVYHNDKLRIKGLADGFSSILLNSNRCIKPLEILNEQGLLSFWRGNGVNILRIVPATMIRFPSYDTYKRISMPRGEMGYSGAERVFRKMEAAFFAGLTTLIVTYPFDLLKTRLSLDNTKLKEDRLYKGIWDCMKKTRKQEGLSTLYRGFLLSTLIVVPYVAISVGVYDLLRDEFIIKKTKEMEGSNQTNSVIRYIGLGSIAGLVAQLATYPLDTLRKKIQANGMLGQKLQTSSFNLLKRIYQVEGIKGLYPGFAPALIKAIPAMAIQFAAYDLLKANIVNSKLI